MKKFLYIPLLLWFCSALVQNLAAQSAINDVTLPGQQNEVKTAKEVYEQETIFLSGDMTHYTKNKKKKRVGIFARHLKKEFDSCSVESKNEIASCVKNRKRGSVLFGSGGLLFVGGIFTTIVAPPVGLSMIAVGLIPYSLGSMKLHESNDNIQKAVWLRNRDMLPDAP